MTPTRILTVCIGISAHRSAALDPEERPLRFAADSARDLSGCFSALWPEPACRHLLLVDEAASLANIGSRLAAESDRYDICILYLGGHARGGAHPYEYMFADAPPAVAAGSSGVIDAIVALPRADSVVLFLDTRNAGKYADETAFFRAASANGARVCIAACRNGQASREDPRIRRSCFADAVLGAFAEHRALDRLAGGDAAAVFSELAARLARHGTALEDATAQEPVLLETSSAALARSVGRTRARGRREKLRQLLPRRDVLLALASASLIVAIVAGLLTLSWHPAINEHGYVELRQGPRWLSFLPVQAGRLRVETDAAAAELAEGAVAAAGASRAFGDAGSHLWPGLNAARMRRWSDVVLEHYLDSEAAARWRVRLGYDGAVERLIGESAPGRNGAREADRPVTMAAAAGLAAEAGMLDPARPRTEIWRRQWRDYVTAGGCDGAALPAETVARLERYLRLADPAGYAGWLRGLALAARFDDAIGLEEVARLVEMFAAAHAVWRHRHMAGAAGAESAGSRAYRPAARPTTGEVDALAAVASAIVARRQARAQAPVSDAERARLRALRNGCGELAMHVLAALGRHGDPAQVIAWSRARPDSAPGWQPALRELAAHGALPGGEIMRILDSQGFAGGPEARQSAFVNLHAWLVELAELMPLPPEVLARLTHYAAERLAAGDDAGTRQALAVVLRSPYAAQPPLDAEIRGLIARVLPPPKTQKMSAKNVLPVHPGDLELLGLLARSGAALTDAQRRMVLNVVERGDYAGTPRVHFTDGGQDDTQLATQHVIVVNATHLMALSHFVIGTRGEDEAVNNKRIHNFLQQAGADAVRADVPLERIRDVWAAAAIVQRKASGRDIDAAGIGDRIRRLATDRAARRAEAEIAKAALSLMPKAQSDRLVDDLRRLWRHEQEPEARLALAEIIIGAVANR